nr:unnamed protein product [Spirometra erinaceieuropaei]
MTKRAKMAYDAATDDPSLPSTSSLVTEPSPEPPMPHLSPEVSIDQLVAWPKDREMQRLLEANRRPTDGAKLYEVKVLKDGLDLGVGMSQEKLDFLSEEMLWLKTNIEDIKVMLADNRRALQTVSFVSKEEPPLLQVPLRTADTYQNFVTKIGLNTDIDQETMQYAAMNSIVAAIPK